MMSNEGKPHPRHWVPDPDSLLRIRERILEIIRPPSGSDGWVIVYDEANDRLKWEAQSGGGPTGAPVAGPYLTIDNDSTLTHERKLIGDAAQGVSITDQGPNSTATVTVQDAVAVNFDETPIKGVVSLYQGHFEIFGGITYLNTTEIMLITPAQTPLNKTINLTGPGRNKLRGFGAYLDENEVADQPIGSLLTFDAANKAIWLTASTTQGDVLSISSTGELEWAAPTGTGGNLGATYLLADDSDVTGLTAYRLLGGAGHRYVDGGGVGTSFTSNNTSLMWVSDVSKSGGDVDPTILSYQADTVPPQIIPTDFEFPENDSNLQITVQVEASNFQHTPVVSISYTDQLGPQVRVMALQAVRVQGVSGSPNTYTRRFIATWGFPDGILGDQFITIDCGDGGQTSIHFKPAESAPLVTNAVWDGNYPIYNDTDFGTGTQTAVKGAIAGYSADLTYWNVTVDAEAAKIIVLDVGLAVYEEFTGPFAAGVPHLLGVRTNFAAANGVRGTTWRAEASNGQQSASDFPTLAVVNVDNDAPIIANVNQGNIEYPTSFGQEQLALKGSEACVVTQSISDFTDVLYRPRPSNPQVLPVNPSTYELNKAWSRQSGGYNINTDNAEVLAFKNTNGVKVNNTFLILIANTTPTMSIVNRSNQSLPGDGMPTFDVSPDPPGTKTHLCRLRCASQLIRDVSLERDSADDGSSITDLVTSPGNNFNFSILIRDTDTHNEYTWQFNAVKGYFGLNYAHRTVVTLTNQQYRVAGFEERQVSRLIGSTQMEFDMGVKVWNTSLVRARRPAGDLTFYPGSPGVPVMTNPGPQTAGFTISDGSGNYDPQGQHFHWLDVATSALQNAEDFFILELVEPPEP